MRRTGLLLFLVMQTGCVSTHTQYELGRITSNFRKEGFWFHTPTPPFRQP